MDTQTPINPVPPTPRRPRTGLIVGLALAGLLVLGGVVVGVGLAVRGSSGQPSPVSSGARGAATLTVHGMLTLADATGVENLDDVNCTGMGGYSDIRVGAQVVVTDQSGTTIAVTQLTGGHLLGSGMTRQCSFDFSVGPVPTGKSFYGITVTHRGTVQYSQAQLTGGVQLTLGD